MTQICLSICCRWRKKMRICTIYTAVSHLYWIIEFYVTGINSLAWLFDVFQLTTSCVEYPNSHAELFNSTCLVTTLRICKKMNGFFLWHKKHWRSRIQCPFNYTNQNLNFIKKRFYKTVPLVCCCLSRVMSDVFLFLL